ncbi:MAG TPA: hypothetical protein VGK02_06515 [Candidatus Aquicultor sp.]|jgi:predicted alpha/beta-hydrolase family hydrolase
MSENVVFENSCGYRLVGVLNIPASKSLVPVVVFAHGASGSLEGYSNDRLVKLLAEAGIASLRFTFTGYGARARKMNRLSRSKLMT